MVDPPTQDCCHVALELSRAKWLLGALPPGRSKLSTALVPGGDTDALLDVLDRFAARASREAGRSVPVKARHEAGHDGFWLARFLLARGVETHVLDPASFWVSRRGRRAKTDRLDVQAMVSTLKAYLLGDRSVCRAVVVPSPEQEDAKRLSRERPQLAAEKTRHANRVRGLLALHGTREAKGLWGGEWAKARGELRTGGGRELGGYLRAEIAREFERLHLVLRHMRALDADREAALAAETSAFPQRHKAGVLIKLAGIGPITATALVAEVFHRRFRSRRRLASYLGLAPMPHASGASERDQAISKAGNQPQPAAGWSSSPGVGCATSPAAAWRPGAGAASPSGASGGGRSGSWPWPASLRSPSGATSRPGSHPREQRSALGEGGRAASAAGAGGRGRRAETARRQGALSAEL